MFQSVDHIFVAVEKVGKKVTEETVQCSLKESGNKPENRDHGSPAQSSTSSFQSQVRILQAPALQEGLK